MQNVNTMETKQVLIVDDSVLTRMQIKNALSPIHSIQCTEVSNGSDCLKLIEQRKFDLILLDLLMPEVSGFDVLHTLKRNSNQTPVLVVSADIQNTTRKKCLELGAISVITKSIDFSDLKTKVTQILNP